MEKNKKRLFAVAIIVLSALLFIVFTACETKTKPSGDGTPQDVALTEKEVKDFLYSVKIDDSANPRIDIALGDSSYWTQTAYYKTDNEEVLSVRTYGTQIDETNYYKFDGTGYTKTTDKYDNGERGFFFVDLTEYEYKKALDDNMEGLGQFVPTYVGMILDAGEDFKAYYPDKGSTIFSGTKKVSGELELNFETVAVLDDEAENIFVTVLTDSEKRVTNMTINVMGVQGFVSDAFSNNIRNVLELTVTYYNVIQVPFCEDCRNLKDDDLVIVMPEHARFPDGFTATCVPGGKLDLPAEAVSDKFSNYEFLGWYYDSDYKYPVKDNVLDVTRHMPSQYVYPKFDLGLPTLELNGGTLTDEALAEVSGKPTLYEYIRLVPEKEGYTFEGWYLDAALTQRLDYMSGDTAASSDKVLYAKFVKTVTIKFVTNADYDIVPQKGLAGNNMSSRTIYQKGKRFVGWYTDSALTKPFDGVFPQSDVTVYAKYEDGVTINLVYYDGVFNDVNTPKYYVAEKNGKFEDLMNVLKGFASNAFFNGESQQFMCWATDTNGTELTYYPTSEITLYAYYVDPAYLVYMLPNGYGITHLDKTIQELRMENGMSCTFGEWIEANGLADNLFYNCGTDYQLNKMDYWYADEACTVKADLTKWPTQGVTLYGKIVTRLRIDFVVNGEVFDQFIFDGGYHSEDSVYEFLKNRGMLQGGTAMQRLPQGSVIEGWYTDEACTVKYEIPVEDGDFPSEVLTVYCKLTTES